MAYIHIKSDERISRERETLKSYGHNPEAVNKEMREYAECVSAKAVEAYKELKRMEGNW